MKTITYLATILLICLLIPRAFSNQISSESTFYSVSDASPNLLYQIKPLDDTWSVVGETGTNSLKALTFNNESNTLFGIDEGVVGTIDPNSGQFTPIGFVNTGEGAYGEVTLSNIEALTYDPFSKLLFAVHRIAGEGANDLFFKMDPQTGSIVKDAVFDFKDRRFDYMPIPEILRDNISIKEVLGLSINPVNYDLIALHVQNGYSVISKLNKRTGEVEEILFNSYSAFTDIAFDNLGNLYATIGDSNNAQSNTFMLINTEFGTESIVNNIGVSLNPPLDFQSLAATEVEMQSLANDLALRLSLNTEQEIPVKQGAVVSFDIRVFNQGELDVNEVRLSVKIDKNNVEVLNLGIDQSNWIQFGNRIYGSFDSTIKPGEHFITSFEVELDDDFRGMMTFESEIYHAYNHNITNEIGKYRPLLDIDAYYDAIDNEINIVNDEINGGGNAVSEDEDDHDIAMIEVERANNLIFSPCYTVSSEENADNVLFEFDPETEKWTEVGITGGTSIEAIATDPVNNLIYAVDGDTFGIININSGIFTPYGKVGYGGGAYGIILLDNIKGLTYDPVNEILYAVHRIEGEGPGTNDVFFQIDVATGGVVPVAMQDPETGSPIDYVIIPEVFPPTDIQEFYDVDDIAYNPYTGQLFAIHNQFGVGGATISVINAMNGTIESVVYAMEDENDLEGMGFTSLGELYGTQGNMGLTEEEKNNFLKIDLVYGETISLGKIDPDDGTPPAEQVDFEAFDCFTAYNDLALTMEVDPSTQQPVSPGDKVTFNITVFNQGDFTLLDVILENYIPMGASLIDYNWTEFVNGTATYFYTGFLNPGDSFKVSISLLINENFEGNDITNAVEISGAYDPYILDPYGNPLPLPDLDSFPDSYNNEINITDNQINGGGPNANQDEDDHDIAVVEVDQLIVTPPPYNTLTKFNCYAVSEDNAAPNVLFEFDAFTGKWAEIGVTGGTSIEAIATDPVSGIIYATDAGQFGTIDAKTAVFTPIGTGVGTALAGPYGTLLLDDIDGLTYDPVNGIMYATHRIEGDGPGTNDVLFQIDVATGCFVPVAMQNPETGSPIDYVIIPEIYSGTLDEDFYEVDDLAYNTYTGQLFAVQNQMGKLSATISEINTLTGEVEAVIYEIKRESDLEGLGFTSLGELYATQGDKGFTEEERNNFIQINLIAGSTTSFGKIDPDDDTPPAEQVDFEAFDCFTAYNDLALKIEVDESTQQPVLTGQTVDFVITIYNQGDFNSSDVTLTNYIPNGLELTDALWTDTGNGKATYIFNETLEPGATTTAYISFKVAEGFEGQTLTNAVEISASYSPVIIDEDGNFFTNPMPDLDSQPDDENNETNISNNEINGSGPNANQDEDDHDIAIIEVAETVVTPPNNNPTYFPCYTVSEDNAAPNVLFEYNPSTQSWTQIGVTGGINIEAIAIAMSLS